MKKSLRQSGIVDDLVSEPSLRVNELAHRYDVSTETIRRDLNELKQRGLIDRTYGGALRLITQEPALSDRQHLMVSERERIAKRALGFIEKDDVIFIGGGITTLYFAKALPAFKDALTVITPSFGVAVALGMCPNISALVLPGEYNGNEGLTQGPMTVSELGKYRATKAFLGASGITQEGPCDAAISSGVIYQAMANRAMQTYVLADSSKFGKPALSCYSKWTATMYLITDKVPSPELSEAMESYGTTIVTSEHGKNI